MNWIMTTKEVFQEYGHKITTERQLVNGQYIQHFETSDPLFVLMDGDSRKTLWTNEALIAYLEWTEPREE